MQMLCIKGSHSLFFFFWLYKIEILLYRSVYVYETSFWRLKPQLLPPYTTSIYTCRITTAPRLHSGHIVLNGLALFGYIFGLLVSFHNINFFFFRNFIIPLIIIISKCSLMLINCSSLIVTT